ncbi:hypothetical protein BZA77DRAFT_301892 [Pyronema omphalodes]|nr:hypothetical protein BZA77DRAFT_301892 [Pyronema omphalodes]
MATSSEKQPAQSQTKSWIPIPEPVKKLFDNFPVVTYPAQNLPAGCPRNEKLPTLWIFTKNDGLDRNGRELMSFNPSCLKWQTYLRLSSLPYRAVPSSNHASPSGALPFLIAPENAETIPSNKLMQWIKKHGNPPEEDLENPEIKALLALVETKLRDAWLYTLYLTPIFWTLTQDLYSTTTSFLARLYLSHELQQAARQELANTRPLLAHSLLTIPLNYTTSPSVTGAISPAEEIYADLESALQALETILGDDEWFHGVENPGYFDATVFGYVELMGMEELKETRLREIVEGCGGLQRWREAVKRRAGW